jgi:pimeloyl-ACP methyl ester carboxylesterase
MHLHRTAPLALASLLAACSSEPATTPPAADAATDVSTDVSVPMTRDLAYMPPPASVVAETGVRREFFDVSAPAPPANPTTNASTPTEYNRVRVIRYRADTPNPTPVRAVIVAMPGFLGGAASFDPLARALVKRGTMAQTPVEVWAIDRRSNLLEDLRGMDMAERMNDPEIASGYYSQANVTIDGRAFAGYRTTNDPALSYMSEWGLATTLRDLRAVIERVPSSRTHVILVGHSLGATLVEAYAAWDFDGAAGYRSIAGLVLVDGVAGGTAISETDYRNGATGGITGLGYAGTTPLRQNGPWFVALPLLGVRALGISEIVARRARAAPDRVVMDPDRDQVFRVLLTVTGLPPMTNAAAMGFAFDDASCPLSFAAMSVGAPTGGPVRMQSNPLVMGTTVTVPASTTDTYRWTDAPSVNPREFTSIANAAAAWSATPSNFSEWYFPSRLTLDASAVGNLRLAADSWQVREGIRAMHGAEIDVPVLGIATALVGRANAYDRVRDRVAASIGTDLPAAGATRMTERGFRSTFIPRMTHIDPLTADDVPENPVPGQVFTFTAENTAGEVTPRTTE